MSRLLITPAGGGTGDVIGPATNTDGNVPQWNGANSKTLKDGFPINATPTANNIPVLNGIAQLPGTAIPLAQGMLLNGKIVPSVASNNLTVAIKGLDGNDPSANNPVYCRIGDTVRTITAALSVTKNAGTNWFNSGQASLATKEIDYFVYLGYNATDGVVIGFSRIIGHIYSDFNTTTTNDNYAAISTTTNAAASDNYELIGRFAATLSAGAGYTWSVPTFTGLNLIQRPIFETRWLLWTPDYTSGGGAFTNKPTTNLAQYKISEHKVDLMLYFTYNATSGGSGATSITQAPIWSANNYCPLYAYNSSTGVMGIGAIGMSANINIYKYDATTMIANSQQVCCVSKYDI